VAYFITNRFAERELKPGKLKRMIVFSAVLLAVPAFAYATSLPFLVTLTIRSAIQVLISEEVDMSEVRQVLNSPSWKAISVSSISFPMAAGAPPLIGFSENSVMASNGGQAKVPIVTFAEGMQKGDSYRYLIGGYISADHGDLKGPYQATATLYAICQ